LRLSSNPCPSSWVQIGHVTFFWNGNRSGYINDKLEQFVEV